VGRNTAAGRYGAWFDKQGNTNDWGTAHVYIESDDLYSWAYGCHPNNCKAGDTHTVTMQYKRGSKVVNVVVTFNIYPGEFDDDGLEEGPAAETKDINISASMNFVGGYTQDGKIEVDKNDVEAYLGGSPEKLVPLNIDGSIGNNTAAKRYGAWFDKQGSTNGWNVGHVYIESDDLYSWAYGCHPDNCGSGDTHTVRMQYQRGNKTVNVIVTFTIK
jgi:hypothetical protein